MRKHVRVYESATERTRELATAETNDKNMVQKFELNQGIDSSLQTLISLFPIEENSGRD